MSFGTAATTGETAATAGNAASSAGSAGSMVEAGASAAPAYNGFSVDAGGAGIGNTPVDGSSVSLTPNQTADVASYGTSNPDFFDKVTSTFDRFNQGGEQSLGQAYKKFGNNPETYGYAYSKLGAMKGGGSAAPSAPQLPAQITNNYASPYDRSRRR